MNTLNSLASILQAEGKTGEAERFYREVLASRTATFGADARETLAIRDSLAEIAIGRKDYAPAAAELGELAH